MQALVSATALVESMDGVFTVSMGALFFAIGWTDAIRDGGARSTDKLLCFGPREVREVQKGVGVPREGVTRLPEYESG